MSTRVARLRGTWFSDLEGLGGGSKDGPKEGTKSLRLTESLYTPTSSSGGGGDRRDGTERVAPFVQRNGVGVVVPETVRLRCVWMRARFCFGLPAIRRGLA
eukprot:scaffold104219_cov51-Phaeocystis_antarctica.AAC.1